MERSVLDNVFTVASEWALMTWVVKQVREVVRRRRRDPFFFLDALVWERITDACTGDVDVVDLPDGDVLLFNPLQALFHQQPVDELIEGCTPDAGIKHLADALKGQSKHSSTGSQVIASARAPTLACTVRIRWFYDPKRRKHMQSELLLEFRQYAPVSEDELAGLQVPPYEDPLPQAYPSWEAWQDAVRTAWQAWDAKYGQAARQAREAQRRLTTPLKTYPVVVWLDHARVPKRLQEHWKAYRQVRKRRLAAGGDTRHEKWMYAQLSNNDLTMLVLLYLSQERMLDLTPEVSQFLQQYFQKFRWVTMVGWEDLFVHMLRHFVLPEDWRTLGTYIRELLRGMRATAVRKAAEAGREQPVVSLETVEAQQQKKRQGYASKPQRPGFVSSDEHSLQFYSVDDVVRRVQAAVTECQQAPSRATVYNWIEKGHRWYGKIDVIRDTRKQLCITEQGLAQVRMIVQVKNRCEKLRKSPGMTAANLNKLYQRYRNPDGTPDLDAIEAHVARCSRKAKDQEPSADTMSLKGKIAACDELLNGGSLSREEREDVQEERETLRQRLRGCHP